MILHYINDNDILGIFSEWRLHSRVFLLDTWWTMFPRVFIMLSMTIWVSRKFAKWNCKSSYLQDGNHNMVTLDQNHSNYREP